MIAGGQGRLSRREQTDRPEASGSIMSSITRLTWVSRRICSISRALPAPRVVRP
jgi:hypothetical protein